MVNSTDTPNLPAQIVSAVAGIPTALVPTCIKALDRLIGATVDIPIAWLAQKKAQIDAQTETYRLVEASIAKAAASEAGADQATVQRAVGVLVRKAYRQHANREAVATAMIEELRSSPEQKDGTAAAPPPLDIDDDWLNVFERYAEDASTERMQKLWGRVLAGEVRKPGQYSMRTLRFLSEFSQTDALMFADFCNLVFGDSAPNTLARPQDENDIRHLIFLESAGLIQGASGIGLAQTYNFNAEGNAFILEKPLALLLKGTPCDSIHIPCCVLTPLGQELLTLLPGRDNLAAARRVALAMRTPQIESAYITIVENVSGRLFHLEILWQKDQPAP